jgi:hypothetical protein
LVSFLEVVEAACWALVVSNLALVVSLVGRRWIRQRYFAQRNSLALRLEQDWAGWLHEGRRRRAGWRKSCRGFW